MKLNKEPVLVCTEEKTYLVPRDKIAAAYAGAVAAKECLIKELSAFMSESSFEEEYNKAMQECIACANKVGLSTTLDLLGDHFNPAISRNYFLNDLIEHKDNPYYPFFDDD